MAVLDRLVEDRIMAALNFEEGDRVPIWDYVDNRAVHDYFARPGETYEQGMVRVYHGLGIDLCRGYGCSFSESDEGEVHESETVSTKVSGRTRWVTKRAIRSLADLATYEPSVLTEEQARGPWVEEIRRRQELFAPFTMYVPGGGCGFHATYGLMGLELFSLAIYEAPDHLRRIMDTLCGNSVRRARAAAEARVCPIFFIGDDIAYKGTTMFSPAFLREWFIPCLRRVCEPLNAAGVKVIFHSDGNINSIIDDLIEAGVDGINPIEPLAGMDIGELKKRYGRRLVLVGNVDCSQVLPLGTRADVIKAVRECIRAASPGGGHFIGSSSEIVPSTPLQNVLTFYRACREFGRYPISV